MRMNKVLTLFLQGIIVLFGLVILGILIRFPLTEGRAENLDLFSIYADPFIIYGYLVSIAFFVSLYEAITFLGCIRGQAMFSPRAVKAIRTIKRCALILSVSIVAAVLYIVMAHHPDDDPAGFIAMGIVTTSSALVVAAVAARIEKYLRHGDAHSASSVA